MADILSRVFENSFFLFFLLLLLLFFCPSSSSRFHLTPVNLIFQTLYQREKRKKGKLGPSPARKSLVVFLFRPRVRLNGEMHRSRATPLFMAVCVAADCRQMYFIAAIFICFFSFFFSSFLPCRIWWCGWQRSTPRSLRRAKKSSSRKDRSEPKSECRRRRRRLLRWRTAAASRTASTATPHRPFRRPKATSTRSSTAVNSFSIIFDSFLDSDFEEEERNSIRPQVAFSNQLLLPRLSSTLFAQKKLSLSFSR